MAQLVLDFMSIRAVANPTNPAHVPVTTEPGYSRKMPIFSSAVPISHQKSYEYTSMPKSFPRQYTGLENMNIVPLSTALFLW